MQQRSTLSREVKGVALAICNGLAGSLSKKVSTLIESESWDELANFRVDPRTYSDAHSYFLDVASASFLRKYEPLPTSIDRKAVAERKFFEAELQCFRTNQRLAPFLFNSYAVAEEPIMDFINLCRREVVELIGERPPVNPEGRFGPGSTYGDRGGLITVPDKMQSKPQFTHGAWPFAVPFAGTAWGRACANRSDEINFVRGNRFTTVPKDATTDRGICVEASGNVFFQLAYGKAMREALSHNTNHRLVLASMQEIHRQVACEASITGSFATLDLKQASDTQSYNFVKLLTPPRWFEPLDDLRSPYTTIQGDDGTSRDVLLEKFSSMGNGYTFELETTLFLAICCAVLRRNGVTPCPGQNVFAYGDDLIVPTQFASEVITVLQYFGLIINKEKSFVEGPFRESCGGDFFNGVDVRPYFLKEEPLEPQHFIAMANGIRRMGVNHPNAYLRWPNLRVAWFRCLDSIPSSVRRCRGPENLGDLCIHDDSASWETRTRNSRRYFRVYRPATYREVSLHVFDIDVQLATLSYGLKMRRFGLGRFVPRDGVLSYKIGWAQFS